MACITEDHLRGILTAAQLAELVARVEQDYGYLLDAGRYDEADVILEGIIQLRVELELAIEREAAAA